MLVLYRDHEIHGREERRRCRLCMQRLRSLLLCTGATKLLETHMSHTCQNYQRGLRGSSPLLIYRHHLQRCGFPAANKIAEAVSCDSC